MTDRIAGIDGTEFLLSLPPTDSVDEVAKIFQSLRVEEPCNIDLLRQRNCLASQEEEPTAGFPQQLLAKVREYHCTRYSDRPEITARSSIVPATDEDDSMILRTYVETSHTTNATAGYWASAWTIAVVDERTARFSSGRIQVHAWCGEDGNVQTTQVQHDVPAETITTEEEVVHSRVAQFEQKIMSYEEQLVQAVVKRIMQIQDDVVYPAVSSMDTEGALRKLRRVFPITKTKFKWDSAAQRNVKLLNERTTNNSKT